MRYSLGLLTVPLVNIFVFFITLPVESVEQVKIAQKQRIQKPKDEASQFYQLGVQQYEKSQFTDSTIKPKNHQCDDFSATESVQPPKKNSSFFVEKICILGNKDKVLNSSEIASIIQTVEGKKVTLEQLGEVADKITQLYLDKGYITSSPHSAP